MTTRKGVDAPNFTAIPNRLFEIFPLMREGELRVTLTIARETFGWRRDRKRLSLSLLMRLTGLSRQGVITAAEAGRKRGTIERYEVKDHRNRKTFEYELIVLSEDASCDEVDRSSKLTGQEFVPVNDVDQSPVYDLDRSPAQPVYDLDPLKESTTKERQDKEKREAPAAPALGNPPSAVSGNPTPPQTPAADAAAPDGASPANARPVQDPPRPPGRGTGQATGTEQVPGGRRGGPDSTEAYLRRKLSSAFVDRVLEEVQPLGVDRRRDWFALPLARAEALVAEAQATHTALGVKVPTRLRDLLDDECRRLNAPVHATPTTPDGEVDMDALMASAPLNGSARRRA